MDQTHRKALLTKQRPALTRRQIQRARSLTASGDQDGELAGRASRQREEFFAHGKTGDFSAPSREKSGRLFERDQRAFHPTGDVAVGETGHGIRLHDNYGDASEQRCEHRWSRDISAHAEYGGGFPFAEARDLPGRFGDQPPEAGEARHDAEGFDPAHVDLLQLESGGGHETILDAALGSHKQHSMSLSTYLTRHGDRRDHVAAGSAAGHYEQAHPACSATLSRIPSAASVTRSELPPKLIIGSGIPLVGIMPSTTLILKNAWKTSMVV